MVAFFFHLSGGLIDWPNFGGDAFFRSMNMTLPLTFQRHDLSVALFSVSSVTVQYGGFLHTATDDEYAPEKSERDANRYPSIKSGEYPAFASLVGVEWRALNGQTLECTLDLDAIFKDRRVLHAQDPARICPDNPIAADVPTIIIELDDRTVNVYMFVTLRMFVTDTTGKRVNLNEKTLAYTRTF